MNATHEKEIVLQTHNNIGIIAELATLLADRGLSISAVNGHQCGEDCVIRLIVDDSLRAKDVLTDHNYAPEERDVILCRLPHKPGMLMKVTKYLAEEGIDMQHIYVTALEENPDCGMVISTVDDGHAMLKLNTMRL